MPTTYAYILIALIIFPIKGHIYRYFLIYNSGTLRHHAYIFKQIWLWYKVSYWMFPITYTNFPIFHNFNFGILIDHRITVFIFWTFLDFRGGHLTGGFSPYIILLLSHPNMSQQKLFINIPMICDEFAWKYKASQEIYKYVLRYIDVISIYRRISV